MKGGRLLGGRPSVRDLLFGLDMRLVGLGLAAIAVTLGLFASLLDVTNLDVWLGVLTFMVLVGLAVPACRWVARKEQDPDLFRILVIAFLVLLAFSMLRYFVLEVIYKGEGDAGNYHLTGEIWASRFLSGEPLHPIGRMAGFPPESQRIGDLTGILYVVSGPSYYAGFLMYATIGFVGRVFMLRALRVAVPEADHRRYDLFVLFLPSLLYWPAAIGKEAVMIGCLGVLSYGGALLLAPRPKARGAVIFAVGVVAVLMIRPHVALMAVGSLVLATAVGVLGGFSGGAERSVKGRAIRLVALGLLVVGVGVVSTRASAMFKEGNDGAAAGTGSALEQTLEQTSIGGSQFTPLTATSPAQLPGAIVSVAFRPFLFEARSLNSLIAAGEGLLLMGLLVVSWRRVASFPRLALRRPYLVFAAGFVVAFSVGFSFVGNFGILARQRTQMLPMVLILLALPPITAGRRRRAGAQAPDDAGDEPSGTVSGAAPAPVGPARGRSGAVTTP